MPALARPTTATYELDHRTRRQVADVSADDADPGDASAWLVVIE